MIDSKCQMLYLILYFNTVVVPNELQVEPAARLWYMHEPDGIYPAGVAKDVAERGRREIAGGGVGRQGWAEPGHRGSLEERLGRESRHDGEGDSVVLHRVGDQVHRGGFPGLPRDDMALGLQPGGLGDEARFFAGRGLVLLGKEL